MLVNFISSTKEYISVINELENSLYLSVDTESNSLYSYDEELCLLQLESSGKIYIIDPFKVDIKPIISIFENNRIEKIFHSASSDISLLKKCLNCKFSNIFDIMIASKYIYKKGLSLKDLVEKYINVSITKKYQRVNWAKRPLSEKLIRYAAYDVYYLKSIRDCLYDELVKKGVYQQFKRYCDKISMVESRKKFFNPQKYISIAHNYKLDNKKTLLFVHLARKREEMANLRKLPPFRILTNLQMALIVKNGLDKQDYPQWVREALLSFNPKDEQDISNNCRYYVDDKYKMKTKILKKWRIMQAELEKISPELILTNIEIKNLASHDKLNLDLLKKYGIDDERINKYGLSLINYFNNKLPL